MSREWKPGDVALIRFNGLDETNRYVRVKGARCGLAHHMTRDHWHAMDGSAQWSSGEGDSVRPLVVIDPDNREQVERLRDEFDRQVITQNGDPDPRDVTPGARGNAMQAALRSLIAPPKPEEPTGLGAVVEDADGDYWVYAGLRALKDGETREWVHAGRKRHYGDIAAVRVLSPGVQP